MFRFDPATEEAGVFLNGNQSDKNHTGIEKCILETLPLSEFQIGVGNGGREIGI